MGILTVGRIRLGATAKDKEDAIRQAGELLVKGGCVTPEYVEGMLERERSMSTYLGVGVSIPHGMYENYAHILQSGLSVLQLPEGVEWEDEEKAHLVIGIASSTDEHIGVLAKLAEAIEDDATLEKLMSTTDPQEIVDLLKSVSVD